jgi:hypothetical protein
MGNGIYRPIGQKIYLITCATFTGSRKRYSIAIRAFLLALKNARLMHFSQYLQMHWLFYCACMAEATRYFGQIHLPIGKLIWAPPGQN